MKDILQDIVSHTHALGFLSTLKVVTDEHNTTIQSITDDRSVILNATTHERIDDFTGTFGMAYLEKLNLLLKNPEYQEDAKIEIVKKQKDDQEYPAYIHFENVIGDFQNDYRFINKEIIDSNLKTFKFKGANWQLDFQPPVASITRMKLMSAIHSEEPHFQVRSDEENLVFSFGNDSTQSGEFVFKHKAGGKLNTKKKYPVLEVQSILSLSGDSNISISDDGVMKISIDSGLAIYEYILPCHTK